MSNKKEIQSAPSLDRDVKPLIDEREDEKKDDDPLSSHVLEPTPDPVNQRRHRNGSADSTTSFRRMSRQLSQTFSEELQRRKPETPAGWAAFASVVSAAVLGYEIRLQKSLTMPPLVYGQANSPDSPLKPIYDEMTKTPESILSRNIQPSLFVGTRGLVSSTAAYAMGGPAKSDQHVRFRQILTMSQDGARVALDWELPKTIMDHSPMTVEQQKDQIRNGPIQQPVVLILHGINNDASFGYMRSLMRACSNRGWNAVGMNFRGCGGVPLATPRGYNGAYTGDIRCVVRHIAARMDQHVCMFVVGNSLGANLITKYLGEEGASGTLPKCIAGGVSLGNPLIIHSGNTAFPWGHLLGLGAKKSLIENWKSLQAMSKGDTYYRAVLRRALLVGTIGNFDQAVASVAVRNHPFYPFSFRIGYKDAESYWTDASSYRLIRHISVPLLQLTAKDDFLVGRAATSKLTYSLLNPHVMVVNTRCGGHLGWQESPPDTGNMFGFGTSWSDMATVDFILAILDQKQKERLEPSDNSHDLGKHIFPSVDPSNEPMPEEPLLRSKL